MRIEIEWRDELSDKQFRLQKVLDVRESVEKEKQKLLSLSKRKLKSQEKQLRDIEAQKGDFTKKMNNIDRQKVRESIGKHNYLSTLHETIVKKLSEIKSTKSDVEKKRQDLLKAVKDKKSLEKLKEKQRLETIKTQQAKEQFFLDEVAQRSKGMNQ